MSDQETQIDESGAQASQNGQAADENPSSEGKQAPETTEAASAEPSTPQTPTTPEEKIAELEAKLAETHDQFLRKAADFENFRKRINQEKQSAIEFANQSLLLDIIPIIDDFERAIQAGETSTDYTGLLEGVKMIEKRFASQLEAKWGLKRFNAAGQPFDPNIHEALYMEKSSEATEAVVQEDLVKGYMLKERVIRAAKVKVLMPE